MSFDILSLGEAVQDQDDTFFAPRKSRSDAIQIMALFDASLLVSLSLAVGKWADLVLEVAGMNYGMCGM